MGSHLGSIMNRKIRVAYVIDHLGPGGAQGILLSLAEQRSPNIEAEAFSLRDRTLPATERRLRTCGVNHRSLSIARPHRRALLRLRAWLAHWRPDLLHTFLDASNSIGPAIALTLGRSRPRIVRQIDNDPFEHYHRAARAGLRWLAPAVDLHIAVSPGLETKLRRLLPWGRIEIVPPGIELARFQPDAKLERESDPDWHGTPVIGTAARLTEQKGLDILIDAVPRIRASLPGMRVMIAGEGPQRLALEEQVSRRGLAPIVRFLGHIEHITRFYRMLDLFVLPSRHEGAPISLLEAMAAGVPVLATRVVGNADVVRDGVTGVLVEPERPDALAETAIRLLRDDALIHELTRQASAWVSAERSSAAMARRVEALYTSLLSY